MDRTPVGLRNRQALFVALLMSCLLPAGAGQSTAAPASAPTTVTGTAGGSRFHPSRFPKRSHEYYELIWGIDSLRVKAAESGELIRFSYEVLDPQKAAPLNDKKLEPKLIAPDSRVVLVIPSLEKVGQLRQSGTPEAGKDYWMAFSNPRRTVKRGDRVDIVIGSFHAQGLFVE